MSKNLKIEPQFTAQCYLQLQNCKSTAKLIAICFDYDIFMSQMSIMCAFQQIRQINLEACRAHWNILIICIKVVGELAMSLRLYLIGNWLIFDVLKCLLMPENALRCVTGSYYVQLAIVGIPMVFADTAWLCSSSHMMEKDFSISKLT